jgi:hypothetical protein
MNEIKLLHRQAMALHDDAALARMRGLREESESLFLQAYEKEREAASLVRNELDLEPTRSVLFRSAAALAMKCGKLRDAEQLICIGLAGQPPHEIAEELRDLFEELNYHRHLSVRGYELSPAEFQISLAGTEVGLGMARTEEVLNRIETATTLVYRTAQRTRGDCYRDKVPRRLKDELQTHISVPRAASFAVSFRISHVSEGPQQSLAGVSWPEQIIDEVMTCMTLMQTGDTEGLKHRLRDEAYLNNFLGLSRLIAPDGERVRLVGFTAIKDGSERRVVLEKSQEYVRKLTEAVVPPTKKEQVTVKGRLLWADATRPMKGNRLRVVDSAEKQHRIVVREGLGDIVRSLWEEEVTVTGEFDGKEITDAQIHRAD